LAASNTRKHAPKTARLADALGEAGWAEADEALAEAWRDFAGLEKSLENLTQHANELSLSVTDIEERFVLARQALTEAGRRRGLRRFGEPGAVERYDAARHALAAMKKPVPKKPLYVRVTAPGVARGSELAPVILIKAEAELAPAPKPVPAKRRRT
jgi:hypothetical protein